MACGRRRQRGIGPFFSWLNETGIDGISHTVKSKSAWEQGIWFAITLVGLGVTIYQVVMVLRSFFSYPVTTSFSVTHPGFVSERKHNETLKKRAYP